MIVREMSSQRFKRVPPEGGWGYLVGSGVAITLIITIGIMPSYGLMFNDFLTGLGEETKALALIAGCFFGAYSFAGLFTNSLMKNFSPRSVGLVGGIVFFIGSVFTIFVTSLTQLLISFSIIQGVGFGLMIPVAYMIFNAYFVERRIFFMSVAQTVLGLGTMVYPILIQKLMDLYGFRGTMAVLAALNGHAIFGMLVMHPVAWHSKKIYMDENFVMVDRMEENDPHKLEMIKDIDDEPLEKTIYTPIQMNDLSQKSVQTKNPGCMGRGMKAVVDFLDLTLLNDPVYVNIVLGISFALYSDVAFFTIQPVYLFNIGISKQDTALIIAIGAGADLIARIFLAITSTCVKIRSRNIYLAGAVMTIAARFAFLYVFDFYGLAIITGIMGFLRTWIHLPLPLVFAEYLPSSRFPSGYGLFMFIQGNITFVVGPIVGWIRDATQSYEILFHCLTFFMALCAVPWLIEYACISVANKKKSSQAGKSTAKEEVHLH